MIIRKGSHVIVHTPTDSIDGMLMEDVEDTDGTIVVQDEYGTVHLHGHMFTYTEDHDGIDAVHVFEA